VSRYEDIACNGKPGMATRGHAEKAIKTMMRARRRRANLAPYRCKVCKRWHVGSTLSRPPRRVHEEAHP
jgi:hypothetical protein